jgi:hypothetical protein
MTGDIYDSRGPTTIELVVMWKSPEDNEFGIEDHEMSERINVKAIWPEGAPDVIDATAVQAVIKAHGYIRVDVPNLAWQPGMSPLPGMTAPTPFITTSVKL